MHLQTKKLTVCTRVGVELSWRCNARCKTCFYHHDERLGQNIDRPVNEVYEQIDAAKARGCDHVVMVGWGEPALSPLLFDTIKYTHDNHMSSSIITNGLCKLDTYKKLYGMGLNHLHVSTHAIGPALDRIMDRKDTHKKQLKLLEYLKYNNLPWRSNTTMQLENYEQLPDIVMQNIEHGCRHFVFLGFLPHYHWNDPVKMRTVAVHPGELRDYIESGIQMLQDNKIYTTVRYHPFCHISPANWKYITNARYVLHDQGEWEYGTLGGGYANTCMRSQDLGESVAIHEMPCTHCDMYEHCGGWNRYYQAGFNGADLQVISADPKPYGHYFMMNPFNIEFKGAF